MIAQPSDGFCPRNFLTVRFIEPQGLTMMVAPNAVADFIAAANAGKNSIYIAWKHTIVAGVIHQQDRLFNGATTLPKGRV